MMDNKAGRAMMLTHRDLRIVTDVSQFRILTRDQLERLGHFQSKTRANAVLLRMVRFGYLSRRYQPAVAGTQRALYFLGSKGVALTEASNPSERRNIKALSDLFLAHQLLITDVHIGFRREVSVGIERWMTDEDLRASQLGIVPDGHIEYTHGEKRFGAFLELDRGTETLGRFQGKVRAYIHLTTSDGYRKAFSRTFFRVLVVAPSATRIEHLRTITAAITDRIFWFTTIERLTVEGPLANIWLRPLGPERHSLTES